LGILLSKFALASSLAFDSLELLPVAIGILRNTPSV
jgi:hypothetical protein